MALVLHKRSASEYHKYLPMNNVAAVPVSKDHMFHEKPWGRQASKTIVAAKKKKVTGLAWIEWKSTDRILVKCSCSSVIWMQLKSIACFFKRKCLCHASNAGWQLACQRCWLPGDMLVGCCETVVEVYSVHCVAQVMIAVSLHPHMNMYIYIYICTKK